MPNWEMRLSLACAWSFQAYVCHSRGEEYQTTLTSTDTARQNLKRDERGELVTLSTRSMVHFLNAGATATWIVFSQLLRHPNVGGVIALTPDIAKLVCNLPISGSQASLRYGFLRILHAESDKTALRDLFALWYIDQIPTRESVQARTVHPTVATRAVDDTEGSTPARTNCDPRKFERCADPAIAPTLRCNSFDKDTHLMCSLHLALEQIELDVLEDFEAGVRWWSRHADVGQAFQQTINTLHEMRKDSYNQHLESMVKILKFVLSPALKARRVPPKRISRWLRSNVRAARHKEERGHQLDGILSPTDSADLIQKLFETESDTRLVQCLEDIPVLATIVRPDATEAEESQKHPPFQESPASASSSNTKKMRTGCSSKVMKERLSKARERLVWSYTVQCWNVEVCVREQVRVLMPSSDGTGRIFSAR